MQTDYMLAWIGAIQLMEKPSTGRRVRRLSLPVERGDGGVKEALGRVGRLLGLTERRGRGCHT